MKPTPSAISTKGRVVTWLRERLRSAQVPKCLLIERRIWEIGPAEVVKTIRTRLTSEGLLIVRSSAKGEDQEGSTNAGRFTSVPDVHSDAELRDAIERVFSSYKTDFSDDEILVQEMVTGLSTVGVAFTADPATGATYLIVNYAQNAASDTITSGLSNNKTWISIGTGSNVAPTGDLRYLAPLFEELKSLLPWQTLDVEFAVANDTLFLFQVRSLKTPASLLDVPQMVTVVGKAQSRFVRCAKAHPHLVGSSTLLGLMPDWNPAEIIGIRPRPLALSLYKYLITDFRWSVQRAQYGYRALVNVPLLVDIHGVPFIDVRTSLNSLIPASLRESAAHKLVDACITFLSVNPEFHDKIEFSILPTCLTADTDDELQRRFDRTFDSIERNEIVVSLRQLTASLIEQHERIAAVEAGMVAQMEARRRSLESSPRDPLEQAYWLLTDCGEFGVRPFVGQARRAFIATDILRSFVRTGIIDDKAYVSFMRDIDTVTRRFHGDLRNLSANELLAKYGHLRPGTYDIRSPRYDEAPEVFLARPSNPRLFNEVRFQLTNCQEQRVQEFLDVQGIKVTTTSFFHFARESLQAREATKFAFTRNLSDALAALTTYGDGFNLSREELSFLDIRSILSQYTSAEDDLVYLTDTIRAGRVKFQRTKQFLFPALISSPSDLVSFVQKEGKPNFIGDSIVSGIVHQWKGLDTPIGAVVFIENADPGFDWLLFKNVAAFVTMYGGANSHMAVRAHELGLTAIIGAGPTCYNRWIAGHVVRIDPINEKVDVVQ